MYNMGGLALYVLLAGPEMLITLFEVYGRANFVWLLRMPLTSPASPLSRTILNDDK